MGYPRFIESNQREKFISIQRVKFRLILIQFVADCRSRLHDLISDCISNSHDSLKEHKYCALSSFKDLHFTLHKWVFPGLILGLYL